MKDTRHLTGWLLLGLLTVVAAGAAALGIVQSPNNAPLYSCKGTQQGLQCSGAVTNTLTARNYTEVLTESSAQGNQTDYLVFQAPDRLGGYVQSGSRRSYIVIIGSVLYRSVPVNANASTKHLTFYRQQASRGAMASDPTQVYLRYVSQAKTITRSGDTYSFALLRSGETGSFSYTVSGQYVSHFTLLVTKGSTRISSVQLVISQVGTSPPVALPAGARVAGVPSGSAR